MGDPRRFDLFAKLISTRVDRGSRIIDVAGGKGYMRRALFDYKVQNTTTWDKTKSKIPGNHIYRYFKWDETPKYDIAVGMHPDEATDHIILYAGLHRVRAFVCPCCVKPSAAKFWKNHNFKHWTTHLIELAIQHGLKVEIHHLPMNGKNLVLEIFPK